MSTQKQIIIGSIVISFLSFTSAFSNQPSNISHTETSDKGHHLRFVSITIPNTNAPHSFHLVTCSDAHFDSSRYNSYVRDEGSSFSSLEEANLSESASKRLPSPILQLTQVVRTGSHGLAT